MRDWGQIIKAHHGQNLVTLRKKLGNEAMLRVKYVTAILIRNIVGCPSTHMGNITEFIGNSGQGKSAPSDLS